MCAFCFPQEQSESEDDGLVELSMSYRRFSVIQGSCFVSLLGPENERLLSLVRFTTFCSRTTISFFSFVTIVFFLRIMSSSSSILFEVATSFERIKLDSSCRAASFSSHSFLRL
uniref:Uncharacterized protein n=1 Tax=Opuntia streptacantha TaxID=393608 RepID=A0A7C8ZTJ2_OPUST